MKKQLVFMLTLVVVVPTAKTQPSLALAEQRWVYASHELLTYQTRRINVQTGNYRLDELTTQTLNVWGVSALDVLVKGNYLVYSGEYTKAWWATGNILKGEAIQGNTWALLMGLSAYEYGSDAESRMRQLRYTISQMLVTNVMENLLFWIHVPLAELPKVDHWSTGEPFNIRKMHYPKSCWMNVTTAGIVASLRGNECVELYDALIASSLLYMAAYLILPSQPPSSPRGRGRRSELKPIFFFHPGHEQGLPFLRAGVKYKVGRGEILFYQNSINKRPVFYALVRI